MCCAAKNWYSNRSGFSPLQRVFGITPRLAGSILSDDTIDSHLVVDNELEDYERAEELRQAATRAWAAVDERTRLQRSLRAKHRLPQTFVEGQFVFVWRQPELGPGRWHGPGIVILPTCGGCWVNMRGALWTVSNEQLRSATADECQGAEIVSRYLDPMRSDIQKQQHGPKKYLDVTQEGHPRFPGEMDQEQNALINTD